MPEPTEADFDALWARIRANHDAVHGEGDAERIAERGRKMFGPALGIAVTDEQKSESIRLHLARMLIKGAAKGGEGWRTAREIAHVCLGDGDKAKKVAVLLRAAAERGDVEIVGGEDVLLYRSALSLAQARALHPEYQP